MDFLCCEVTYQTAQERDRMNMRNRLISFVVIISMLSCILVGCGETSREQAAVEVFIAASLKPAMEEIVANYTADHDNVKINLHADSSGTLLTQIEEGYECDIFFSAATKQMDQLEQDGLVEEGTRKSVLNNQVVLIKGKGQRTKVTGLTSLNKAKSIALAAGSVPVGKYTREALKNLDILKTSKDSSEITTTEISKTLGDVEISEQSNVSKVLLAVAEGSCEVGTVYLSDTYGYEDKIEMIETVSNDLTGDVVYPVCLVKNEEADETQRMKANEFYEYLLRSQTKDVFAKYNFDIDLEK